MNKKRGLLELLNGLMFGLAILGANVVSWLGINLSPSYQVLITFVLVLAYIFVAYEKNADRVHSFKEGSSKFTEFFLSWYSQDGVLSIFCTDLDWLDNPDSAGIVYHLKRKKNNLRLYLRKQEGRIVEELQAVGAQVYVIKASVRTQHRLSLLQQNGLCKLIVRNKDMETQRIVFVETDNTREPYLTGLAEDLLDDCYERAVQ